MVHLLFEDDLQKQCLEKVEAEVKNKRNNKREHLHQNSKTTKQQTSKITNN
jgi:hypothetical protein